MKHLHKILDVGERVLLPSLATLAAMPMLGLNMPAWLNGMNPIAAFLMSTAICARWTMVGYHTCHGGYNAAAKAPTVKSLTIPPQKACAVCGVVAPTGWIGCSRRPGT